MRAAGWSCALAFGALIASAAQVHAQNLPPPFTQIEPLPPVEAAIGDPPVEYFDLDAWQAGIDLGPLTPRDDWTWQLLPDGILYRAYLANPKESRLGTQLFNSSGDGAFWDSTLGGRMGLLRFGTTDPSWPQGWQLDIEGSAQVRLDPDENLDLRSVDYRVGAPLTYGYGRHRLKFGFYHLCSHLGDEFLIAHPSFTHVNFVRDVLSLGYAYYVTENLRVYSELGWAFRDDVSKEWEFQFGLDYSPARPTGIRGAPFFAVHGHLREELNYSGNFVLQAGWAWRGDRSSHLLRTGLHYYNGLSDQYSFYRNFEQQIGAGVWYDY
jgi:uncharacterized protein DUF1207